MIKIFISMFQLELNQQIFAIHCLINKPRRMFNSSNIIFLLHRYLQYMQIVLHHALCNPSIIISKPPYTYLLTFYLLVFFKSKFKVFYKLNFLSIWWSLLFFILPLFFFFRSFVDANYIYRSQKTYNR